MAIFKVTAVPDFSQLKGEIAKLQSSQVTLGVDTRQANVNIKATTKEIKNAGKAAKETSGFADLMGKSFSRIVLQMATWQMLGNAIAGVKRSFVEALDTMKSVDDEMVTIRKVTGATTAELNKIEKQAYDTASAYGVAADEYLQFVSGFSRAGYGEQASALAELAAKTQIVGDTNAETAQQFLLSVDAAYKYQGNIEKLTAVLDGANEIDNRYATSIQKVAEGLGKVAPIAAQAHVGVDELTAAIGTITAVTQRSGTEAATALRALFLNIIGDTKTEIDEGVTWTTGEIAGLRDVIKVYAKDAYDAAQATGSVINPMKAIAGLSKSMKDGLLTEQQLMEMVSDIGGKLRTSQLLALIQNWDMYESMLTDFAGAAGSADKEVENALDSWTRKTEILNNKWTQFISHLMETDTIKGALDGVIGLVEFLDSDLGHLTLTIGGVTLAVVALSAAQKKIAASEAVTGIAKVSKALQEAIPLLWNYAAAKKAAQSKNHAAESALTFLDTGKAESLISGLKTAGWMAVITLAIAGVNKGLQMMQEATDYLNRSFAEFDSDIKGTNDSLEENRARLAEIAGMEDVWQTDEILAEKAALEETNAELEKQIANLEKVKVAKAKLMVGGEKASAAYVSGGTFLGGYRPGGGDAWESKAESAEAYLTAIQGATELTDAQRTSIENLLGAMDEMMAAYEALKDGGEKLTDAQQRELDAYYALKSAYDWATGGAQRHVDALIDEAKQAGDTGKALYDLVAAQITASSTELNFSQQIAALRQLAAEAGYAAEAYGNLLNAGRIYQQAMVLVANGKFKTLEEAQAYLTDKAWSSLTSTAPSGGWNSSAGMGSGGSGGGSGSGSDSAERKRAQAEIDALKKARDAEIEPLDDQIDALKKQNEEIERGEKLEELKLDILKKQDALLNARNERTVRMYNAATGQWEWVADARKVKDAEEALEDAKKDLRDYERQTELDLAIEELEARKEAIKAAYQIKIDAWQDYLDGLSGAVDAEGAYIAQSVQQNKDAAQEIAGAWESTAERIKAAIASMPEGNLDSWKETKAGSIISDVMDDSGRSTGGKPLDVDNRRPTGMASGSLGKTGEGYTIGEISGKRGNTSGGTLGSRNISRAAQYDSGGVLKGLGGIKATADDEMVLPPDITAWMLRPSANAAFQARMRELRGLYDPTPAVGRSLAGNTDNRSYTDHSGPEYHYGNITLTQAQAEATTVAEFMRMAHHLQPYKG
jgi:TP901 family phage tail tape measure protein